MNSFFHKLSVCLGVQCLLLATSCDYMYDDDLPPCDYHLRFVYDYNMKFADAFQKEVEHATLFVFDQSGVFLQKRQIEGEELKRNRDRPAARSRHLPARHLGRALRRLQPVQRDAPRHLDPRGSLRTHAM